MINFEKYVNMQVKNLNTSSINYDINKAIYIRKILERFSNFT